MKRTIRIVCGVIVMLGCLQVGMAQEEPVTRVIYLDGMDTREAVTLLRVEVQVRQIAELRDRGVLILRDAPARVDRSEELLRARGGVKRVAEPHGPVAVGSAAGDDLETREFRLEGIDPDAVSVILRAIYQVPDVDVAQDAPVIRAGAPPAVLDAAEALLVELDVLAA